MDMEDNLIKYIVYLTTNLINKKINQIILIDLFSIGAETQI